MIVRRPRPRAMMSRPFSLADELSCETSLCWKGRSIVAGYIERGERVEGAKWLFLRQVARSEFRLRLGYSRLQRSQSPQPLDTGSTRSSLAPSTLSRSHIPCSAVSRLLSDQNCPTFTFTASGFQASRPAREWRVLAYIRVGPQHPSR